MTVKAPTACLPQQPYEELAAGDSVHRVYQTAFGATEFNPCRGQPTRFAPIYNSDGQCIPSLYAGSTLQSVIHETIFHDVPATANLKTVPIQSVLIRSHAELKVRRGLRLVALRNVNLHKWKIRRQELIGSSPKLYKQTAQWAEAIHQQFPDAEGLVWTSNQCDPDSAYLFFGDRVATSDFTVHQLRDAAMNEVFLNDIRVEGKRRGITITL